MGEETVKTHVPYLAILKKFKVCFEKKNIYFSRKKSNILTFREILLFQSHSAAKLLQFGEKISRSNHERTS